jgi:hypothetical protein
MRIVGWGLLLLLLFATHSGAQGELSSTPAEQDTATQTREDGQDGELPNEPAPFRPSTEIGAGAEISFPTDI